MIKCLAFLVGLFIVIYTGVWLVLLILFGIPIMAVVALVLLITLDEWLEEKIEFRSME